MWEQAFRAKMTFYKALIKRGACSGVASPKIYSRYANFKLLLLFIS